MSRSTFYYQRNALGATDKYAELKKRIRKIYRRHRGRYGYRRITDALRKIGDDTNHKTVQRLMVTMGLKAVVRQKKYRSYRGDMSLAAPNLLNREFGAAKMNQKWVTDVTEFNLASGKLYLSPVMDLYNGEIISFEIADRPKFELVTKMLRKALQTLSNGERPMLHSDQGWHYRMPLYKELLDASSVVQSMSRKGNCLDNSPMESFFAVLKTEYFHLNQFTSTEQLKRGLMRYIKYYNNERIKTRLRGLSPVEYRTQTAMA